MTENNNGETGSSQLPANSDSEQLPIEVVQELPPEAARIVERLSEPEQAVIVRAFREITVHQGPLPDPDSLERYNRTITDGANRIMTMAEEQAKHRQAMEALMVNSAVDAKKRGQHMAFGLVLFLSLLGAYLGAGGHDWLAGTVFTSTIIAVVTVFLGKKRKEVR